jgi:hypothetical protein
MSSVLYTRMNIPWYVGADITSRLLIWHETSITPCVSENITRA